MNSVHYNTWKRLRHFPSKKGAYDSWWLVNGLYAGVSQVYCVGFSHVGHLVA